MSFDSAIRIEGVSKRYAIYDQPRDRLKQFVLPNIQRPLGLQPRQYFREFWALREVSFEIGKGETVGIVGRNGSGKSTLLQIVTGTLAQTSGVVVAQGRIAALLELGSGFNPEFTGRENVYLNGALLGISKAQINERFDQIAAFADIGEHLDQAVRTYSSGMYVRLAFAVQACLEPDILIVDEALSVGDERFQRKCFDYIERLRKRGCSILLVTHSTAIVERFCQRALLLHQGRVHGIGSAKQIVDQYHALLYSDERAYHRYLNTTSDTRAVSLMPDHAPSVVRQLERQSGNMLVEDSAWPATLITQWCVLRESDEPCTVFRSGDIARIHFVVQLTEPIREVQAGIRLRTVEGVTAFGTSSSDHAKNYQNPGASSLLRFEFTVRLDLCAGPYFITLAIAEAMASGGIRYLDKKTDVIVIKVTQSSSLSSGIAALESSVDVCAVKP